MKNSQTLALSTAQAVDGIMVHRNDAADEEPGVLTGHTNSAVMRGCINSHATVATPLHTLTTSVLLMGIPNARMIPPPDSESSTRTRANRSKAAPSTLALRLPAMSRSSARRRRPRRMALLWTTAKANVPGRDTTLHIEIGRRNEGRGTAKGLGLGTHTVSESERCTRFSYWAAALPVSTHTHRTRTEEEARSPSHTCGCASHTSMTQVGCTGIKLTIWKVRRPETRCSAV